MRPESPFLCSQEPATESYPDSDESSAHHHTLFKICFNIIIPPTPYSSKRSLPDTLPTKSLYAFRLSPACYMLLSSQCFFYRGVSKSENGW